MDLSALGQRELDLPALRADLEATVAAGELAGASYAVLTREGLVASACVGWADREAGVAMRPDHLFRIYSNTKLVTSCAALQLLEQGRFGLDDPVAAHLPALQGLRVLRPGAVTLHDTEALREPIRIRHLFTHTAGFTYAYREPGTLLGQAYQAANLADPALDSRHFLQALARLPLVFQPGSAWNYSVATDVLGVLVEAASGLPLDAYFQRHIFDPLDMRDTFFWAPPDKAQRLAPMYLQSGVGGLVRAEGDFPHRGAFLTPQARLSGGGGLVSSLRDFSRLVGTLLAGGAPLLSPQSMPLLLDNQLPAGMWIGKPPLEGRGHSCAASVTQQVSPTNPATAVGEVQWGGVGGTHWFFSPSENLAVVLMAQRFMGYGLPFWLRFKQAVRRAMADRHTAC